MVILTHLSHGVAVDLQLRLEVALLQEDLGVVDVHVHAMRGRSPGDPQGWVALQLGGYRVPELLDRQRPVRCNPQEETTPRQRFVAQRNTRGLFLRRSVFSAVAARTNVAAKRLLEFSRDYRRRSRGFSSPGPPSFLMFLFSVELGDFYSS